MQSLLRGGAHFGIEMLASRPKKPSVDLEEEEKTLKERVVKLETALANQPEENRAIRDLLDQVKTYYGSRGQLQTDVRDALVGARVRLEAVQRNVTADPTVRHYLNAVYTVHHAALAFLKRHRTWDATQDDKLRAIREGEERIRRRLDTRISSETNELRWWWRKMGLLEARIDDLRRKYEWEVTKGIYKLRPKIEEKGQQTMQHLFRKGGLWDQAVASLGAYLNQGLANETARFRSVKDNAQRLVDTMEEGTGATEIAMANHTSGFERRVRELRESMERLHKALALSSGLINATNRQSADALSDMQGALDARAEAIAVHVDPCLGSELTASWLREMLRVLSAANKTAGERAQGAAEEVQGKMGHWIQDKAEMIRKQWEKKVEEGKESVARGRNITEGLLLAQAESVRRQEETEEEKRLRQLLDERALILDILRMLDNGGLSADKVAQEEKLLLKGDRKSVV